MERGSGDADGHGEGLAALQPVEGEPRIDAAALEVQLDPPGGTSWRVKRPEPSVTVCSEVPVTLTRRPFTDDAPTWPTAAAAPDWTVPAIVAPP